MKKLMALLIVCIFAMPIFADDAKVMPAGVGRFYLVPTYSFASGEYLDDGEYKEADETAKLFLLSAALEFGITDWITAAVQWTPGYILWSDTGVVLPPPFGFNNEVIVKGAYPLFAGAKFQIIGENAPVKNDQFRVAAALGAQIPMPTPDWEEQFDNYLAGDEVIIPDAYITAAKPVYGIGARGYADYIFNENVYFNFYTEYIKYFEREFDLEGFGETTYNFGHKLTLELEPRYTTNIAEGVNFEAGLPLTTVMTPESEVDDVGMDDDSYTFKIGPSAKFFFTKTPLPIELKAGYQLPLFGKNAVAQHAAYLQARVYFKAY